MKSLIVQYDSYLSDSNVVFRKKEPGYLHNIIWIVVLIIVTAIFVVTFGHMDEVVNAGGVVRPVENVSRVKNITAGEIESLNYKIGEFVKAGTELLRIKPDMVNAEKESIQVQMKDIDEKLYGLKCICKSFISDCNYLVDGENCTEAIRARYKYYCSERDLLKSSVIQTHSIYIEETEVPDYARVFIQERNARYDYEQAVLNLKEFKDGFYSQINQEILSYEVQKESLKQSLNQVLVQLKNLIITAPVSGYVQEISSLNPGDYIFADQDIINLVPSEDDNLRIALQVPAGNMGKIKAGQKVRFRFPAFPYYEFKGLEGSVTSIQPDSQLSQGGQYYYVVYADISEKTLKNFKNEVFKIKSGLEVDARIVMGDDTLLHFLLKKLNLWI